ncbi:MAG: aspartate aminotransferase family protein [Burkholderiales bacterium]|nr:aspartate aminotransferase family protein [Burkholderiales bacterium]
MNAETVVAGVDTRAVQAMDSANYMHPFTDTKELSAKGARVIVKGDGIYVWDSEGKKILDGMSGLWCVNVGYGRTELAETAYKQMNVLPYYNSFFNTTNLPAVELAKAIVEIAPEGFHHVFFTGSGSEGNDTIFRMVRRYWDLQNQPQKKTIIARNNAYHGSTVCGASLGGMKYMHEQGDLPIQGITHIEQPYYFEHGKGMTEDEFGLKAARWLEDKILSIGADKVGAFIGEPVQGAGGVIIPPKTYWPEIQRICRKYDVLLVSDEVICGFGRTGQWFGCQTLGYQPDLITFAKGVTSGYLPLGGVLVGDRVAQVLIEKGGDFNHGFTYSGHPVTCAVALENIAILKREKLVSRIHDDVGPYLKEKFEALVDHPLVGISNSLGLMAGLLLVKNKATMERFGADEHVGLVCRGHMFSNGMIMRHVGDRMIIAPPFVITREQIDGMIALIRKCLDATLEDVKARGWL